MWISKWISKHAGVNFRIVSFTTAHNISPPPLPPLTFWSYSYSPSPFVLYDKILLLLSAQDNSYNFGSVEAVQSCLCMRVDTFCFLLSCLVRAVQHFDFKFTIRWASNKLWQGKWQRYACSTNLRFLHKAKEESNNPNHNVKVQYVLVTRGEYVLRILPIRVPLSKLSV